MFPLGLVLVLVVLGWYALFFGTVFSRSVILPAGTLVALSFFLPAVPIELIVLLIGVAVQWTLSRPRKVFWTFLVLELAAIAMTLVDGTVAALRVFSISAADASGLMLYGPSLGYLVLQALALFVLLALAKPPRHISSPPATLAPAAPTQSLPLARLASEIQRGP